MNLYRLTAAVFFGTYEYSKSIAERFVPVNKAWAGHMMAACAGETVSVWGPITAYRPL